MSNVAHQNSEGTPLTRLAPEHAAAERSMLAKADAILAVFDSAHPTISLPGIVAATGLPKTTVYRTVEKLLEMGWLARKNVDPIGGKRRDRYAIGPRLFEIATLIHLRTNLREVALPFMQDLYEATHETIHLAVLEGDHVLYAEKISGHRPTTELSRVGGRMPVHCTAVGKAMLAFATKETVDAALSGNLQARTPSTITTPDRLSAELKRVRIEQVAYDREETAVGMVCVAAPVFDPAGRCVAAMSITGPVSRLRVDRVSPAVRTAALGATRALGARASYPGVRPPDGSSGRAAAIARSGMR
jgi:DNA-binding IclR family transcriptional regulator